MGGDIIDESTVKVELFRQNQIVEKILIWTHKLELLWVSLGNHLILMELLFLAEWEQKVIS